MINKIKIELLYFFAILIILAIIQHSDLLSSPLTRAQLMIDKGNYLHPLLWTSVIYLVLGVLRVIAEFISAIINRKKN